MKNKMTKKDQNKEPKPNLSVSITLNSKTNKYESWLHGGIIEFQGIFLEERQLTKTTKAIVVLFENVRFGEDFYTMISNTNLKVTKELF